MTPIASDAVELPEGRIHYRDVGTGDPIVFVHGFFVNGRLWERPVELLRRDFRCIVPDWPMGSHKEPMNPDADITPLAQAGMVSRFLEELDLDRVTLVGNDSGGAISQLVATKHPERIGRLVLTNCDTYKDFPPKLFAYLGLVARIPGGTAATLQSLRIKPLRRSPIAFGVLTKSRLADELLDEWINPALHSEEIRRDTRKFLRGFDPALTVQAAEDLERFNAPTLFAWAPEDRWFKIANAERLAAAMPDARVVRIPDSKTFVPYDQPQKLAEELGAFIRETKPVAATA